MYSTMLCWFTLYSIVNDGPFLVLFASPYMYRIIYAGGIPVELGQLSNLKNLDVSCNQLTGKSCTMAICEDNVVWKYRITFSKIILLWVTLTK